MTVDRGRGVRDRLARVRTPRQGRAAVTHSFMPASSPSLAAAGVGRVVREARYARRGEAHGTTVKYVSSEIVEGREFLGARDPRKVSGNLITRRSNATCDGDGQFVPSSRGSAAARPAAANNTRHPALVGMPGCWSRVFIIALIGLNLSGGFHRIYSGLLTAINSHVN